MAPVLEGLTVVDLSQGVAGPVTTMLLADYGADVVKVEPPGGDPTRAYPGAVVWTRGKRSVELDLKDPAGLKAFRAIASEADVLVESFSPGTTARLGVDYDAVRSINERIVYCSITGYGTRGRIAQRPGYDALVQARSGMQNEQPGLREGPIFLHAPLPSYGAALLASVAIHAALHARTVTGLGQQVETSLMQGSLVWMTQIWKRATTPTPALMDLWKYKDLGPTPCFEASDGEWFHPMPAGVAVALRHVGRDPSEIDPSGLPSGDLDKRRAYFDAVRQLYLQRPRDEWVDILQRNDVSCQPIAMAQTSLDHPQIVNNRTSTVIDIPGLGPVKQFGRAYHLERHDEPPIEPPPGVGEHHDEVIDDIAKQRAVFPRKRTTLEPPTGTLWSALSGIRVLDFGTALAGPFGPMILSDLGADVIKIDPLPQAGSPGDATFAACHRGKRSIAIDLKTEQGQEIAKALVASADVVHYNLRTGVAERLGFGYEQAKAINPRIIFCHLTGYGNTGPLAKWPGVDQMGQALCGLEYEQGATPNGGHPSWYRFGMCDATTGLLSILGVLQALGHRDRTGEGQSVEANILSAAMLLASDAFVGPEGLMTRPHLDRQQTGLGPLYRLYETADGWICIVVTNETQWKALIAATGRRELLRDLRFYNEERRQENAEALGATLAPIFRTRTADAWFSQLDRAGVPCEIASIERGQSWYDEPDVVLNRWVARYEHPVWGRLEQPGRFFDFSGTPSRIYGPPPVIGQHTKEILTEIGFKTAAINRLKKAAVVGW